MQGEEAKGGRREPLQVQVWFDFASALCYVAQRVLGRLAAELSELGVLLCWTPLDLAQLLGPANHPRGAAIPEARRENAERVARELGVTLQAPTIWHDSRPLGAVALLLAGRPEEFAWRERVFSALFEEGRAAPDAAEAANWARALGLELNAAAIEKAQTELAARTEAARGLMVCGVPTLMLGGWPCGGIQSEETMRGMLRRYAARAAARPGRPKKPSPAGSSGAAGRGAAPPHAG